MDDLIPFAIKIGFALLWVGIWVSLSRFGGWANLAKHDLATTPCPRGKNYYMCSGFVGGVNYESCSNLRVCDSGLRLSVGHAVNPPVLT